MLKHIAILFLAVSNQVHLRAEKISGQYAPQALKQNGILLMGEQFVSISLIWFWSMALMKENGPKKYEVSASFKTLQSRISYRFRVLLKW
jgi:hypothetical protein